MTWCRVLIATASFAVGGCRTTGDESQLRDESTRLEVSAEGIPGVSPRGEEITPQIARGPELTGMPTAQRQDPRYQRMTKEIWRESVGGRDNYGLGDLPPTDPFPAKRDAWTAATGSTREEARTAVREHLFQAITAQSGGRDPRQVAISWSDVTFTRPRFVEAEGVRYHQHDFYFPTGNLGMRVTGRILIPEIALARHARGERSPAVIYEHFHGGIQELGIRELWNNWNVPGEGPPATALTRRGYIVIATDVHGFRARRIPTERTPNELADIQDEFADSKALLAHGMSRYAVRSFEDFLVFRLIASHPLVDPARIGAMGMSMGSVRTWTLAALAGDGLKVGVPAATFPRFRAAVERNRIGAHRNTQTLLDQLTGAQVDTEDFVFAAMGTNLLMQLGGTDPSSPGSDEVFSLTGLAAPGKQVAAEVEPGLDHNWSTRQLRRAYGFIERQLQ